MHVRMVIGLFSNLIHPFEKCVNTFYFFHANGRQLFSNVTLKNYVKRTQINPTLHFEFDHILISKAPLSYVHSVYIQVLPFDLDEYREGKLSTCS